MSRINGRRQLIGTLAAALLLLTTVSYAEEDILNVDELTPEQVNYKTEAVSLGVFEKTNSYTASEYYPLTYGVSFENSGAKFIEYAVARGDEVKKGDVLARFEITGSDVRMTSMELNLTRTEETTTEGVMERQEAIAQARAALAAENDAFEKKKKELSLRKLELELEQYRYRQEYSIESQKQALEEEKERRSENVLLAPIDGVVSDLSLKKADDAVLSGEVLVTISSKDVMLLKVDNANYGLRYNMPVKVTSGNNAQRVELTGRVVAADDSIAQKERTGQAYILLDPYDSSVKLRTLQVTAPTLRVENVLISKRGTATSENGKYYVTKLVDGMVQKRYVTLAMQNTTNVWFLSGVSEGETLIID